MGLTKLLGKIGIKPSADKVASIVVNELERIIPFYSPQGHLNQLTLVSYSQGGCECGCAPEFQFFYDNNNLGILPCFIDSDSIELIKQHRTELKNTIKKKLGIEQVDIVIKGEKIPEYVWARAFS
jgi:hypothetical protein